MEIRAVCCEEKCDRVAEYRVINIFATVAEMFILVPIFWHSFLCIPFFNL